MCQQPAALTKTTTRRVARWVFGPTEARESLSTTGIAALMISVNSREEYYWLVKMPSGFRLWVEREDGEPQFYELDASLGMDADAMTCTCDDYRYRSRRKGACKHILAVIKALERINFV